MTEMKYVGGDGDEVRVLERVKVNKWKNENLIRGKTQKNRGKGKF